MARPFDVRFLGDLEQHNSTPNRQFTPNRQEEARPDPAAVAKLHPRPFTGADFPESCIGRPVVSLIMSRRAEVLRWRGFLMSDGPLSLILRYLRRRASATAGAASDGQLLARFASRHEEAAFAALMGRHGPMVLSVCRRVLPHAADVEDAFQATFLTLVRKAGSIRKQSSVAGWLYRVAYHAAIRTRARTARDRAREGRPDDRVAVQPTTEAAWRGIPEVLDNVQERQQEKYRAPLSRCYLEGQTHEEAAQQLGWPPGTVKGRLARARDLLRARLTRRGLGPVAGSFATVLAVNSSVHA